jgi:hypothetical protein
LRRRLSSGSSLFRGDIALACLLVALKLGIDALVLRAGFSHVSDDDYARTVIAQQFAHAPRLDPSGTSWLPFPFWVAGAWMLAFGRSLGTSRAIAVILGALGVAAPFGAMRAASVPRAAAALATSIAMALPWSAWLGVATVPDGWTGALIAAGAVAMIDDRARPWAAVALFIAALSRYEAWPACVVFASFCATRVVASVRRRAVKDGPTGAPLVVRREVACALVALAGPALWMAWNVHAHGSALHFIARVSTFRRAIGAAQAPWLDKLLGYPRALLLETPEAAVLGACGGWALLRDDELRNRWRWAAASALAIVAFLIGGDLNDGAPTHHPARALGSVWWIFTAMGVDALRVAMGAARFSRRATTAAAAAVALGWLVSLPSRWAAAPGLSEPERRDMQIARGLELRARAAPVAEITPCQFEHFALMAAWGEPERARVHPRTQQPLTIDCPLVTTP